MSVISQSRCLCFEEGTKNYPMRLRQGIICRKKYGLNRLDEPVFMAVPKPMLTEFGIHCRLESCGKGCPVLNDGVKGSF